MCWRHFGGIVFCHKLSRRSRHRSHCRIWKSSWVCCSFRRHRSLLSSRCFLNTSRNLLVLRTAFQSDALVLKRFSRRCCRSTYDSLRLLRRR